MENLLITLANRLPQINEPIASPHNDPIKTGATKPDASAKRTICDEKMSAYGKQA